MIFTHKFIVITCPGGPGGYDNGHWTGHSSRKDAIECAYRVHGYVYKVKRKGDAYKIVEVTFNREDANNRSA